MDPRLRFLAFLCGIALCAAAAMREITVWRSDFIARERTPERLRTALALTPDDAAKWRQLGIAQLQNAPGSAAASFNNAVALNRFETDAFLGLAFLAESQNRLPAAESFYRQAVESSRRFKPAYALAAFYARAGRLPDFQRTARVAAAIDKADVARIIRLARNAGANPDEIPTFLDLQTEHALAVYLPVALAENRLKPLAEVALRLPATPEHQPALLQACERLIDAGAADAAVAVWNRLGAFDKLDPAAGQSLTNPLFAYNQMRGFNWRHNPAPGIERRPAAAGLRIELSGDQPEDVLLLEQIAPVLAQRSYRLSVRADAADLSATAGLSWQIQCVPALPQPIAATAVTGATLSTPPGCNLLRAALVYRRQPGTVRITGTLHLLSARLELLP